MDARSHMLGAIILAVAFVMLFGCSQDTDTQAPEPVATTQPGVQVTLNNESRHSLTQVFDKQVHNALINDLVISEGHFHPRRPLLSELGRIRLARLALVVEEYGGTILIDLEEPFGDLAQQRKSVVREYLDHIGLPEDKIKLKIGLSVAKGQAASEVISEKSSCPLTN